VFPRSCERIPQIELLHRKGLRTGLSPLRLGSSGRLVGDCKSGGLAGHGWIENPDPCGCNTFLLPDDDAAGCLLFLVPSRHSLLIAAAALGAEEAGEGVDRSARIGMGVEAATAWGTEATPMVDEEGAAK
jgi:hypothetical protein